MNMNTPSLPETREGRNREGKEIERVERCLSSGSRNESALLKVMSRVGSKIWILEGFEDGSIYFHLERRPVTLNGRRPEEEEDEDEEGEVIFAFDRFAEMS